MTQTILEKNLEILIKNFDKSTNKAGTSLKKISKSKIIDEAKISQALFDCCNEAKPTAKKVIALIRATVFLDNEIKPS